MHYLLVQHICIEFETQELNGCKRIRCCEYRTMRLWDVP